LLSSARRSRSTAAQFFVVIEQDGNSLALLGTRAALGITITLLGFVVIGIVAILYPTFDWFDPLVAFLGGVAAMVAVGPVTVFRAQSRIFEFTALAFLLQAGMTAPRLMGLWVQGVSGCYGALLIWYGGVLAILSVGRLLNPPRLGDHRLMIRGVPLFVYATAFPCFLFMGRWIAAMVMNAANAGLFSFGANIIQIAVGTAATIGQVVYPTILASRRDKGIVEGSRRARKVFTSLSIVLFALIGTSIVAVPVGVAILFPKFASAVPCVLFMLPSILPLTIVSWLLPVGLSLTRRPIRDASLAFGPAVITLLLLILLLLQGDDLKSFAIATTFSSIILYVSLFFLCQRDQILTKRDTILCVSAVTIAVVLLCCESVLIETLS
jgi:O-antigen/teichoic acid export membrane protein